MTAPLARADTSSAAPRAAGDTASPPREALPRGFDLVAHAAALLVIVAASARLWGQAAVGRFATDECFHAYASEWILRHRAFPTVMPEFYSGFYYYYHPLLHVLGAAWAAAFGLAALHVLPAAFAAALLVLLWGAEIAGVPRVAARWAALLCVMSTPIASFAVRLYVESLTTLLVSGAALAWLAWRRRPDTPRALLVGALVGLTLLAKFTGWMLFAGLVVAAVWEAVRGRRRNATSLAGATALALAFAAPWLVRNQLLFGSALYPFMAPDVDRALLRLGLQHFSTTPGSFVARIPWVLGPALGAAAVEAMLMPLVRRRFGPREEVLALAIVGMLATAFVPFAQDRHLNPFIPLAALAGAWAVWELAVARRFVVVALDVLMLAAAVIGVTRMPDHRATVDLPPFLVESFAAMAPHVADDGAILSVFTYDTYYYVRRPATWPLASGQRERPTGLFDERDPERLLGALRRHRIRYVFVPRTVPAAAFNGANYSEDFMNCTRALIASGRLEIAWTSAEMVLLRVRD